VPAYVHADDALLVVDKPAGLLAVPGRGAERADCPWQRVRARYADALVVHRLDEATSGLMVFARGAPAQRTLAQAFATRAVHKGYVAVVAGAVAGEAGEIDLPLAADWPNRPRQRVDPHGKPALTRWRVLARDGATTRLALQPVSGRSHQLRVHLLAIGHPIVGDRLYAPPPVAAAAPRLLLHARTLALRHPTRGVVLGFDVAAPF
jgi:tRNA pseudouridine32 synthase/23S rRNA pseudouridine746 synthase